MFINETRTLIITEKGFQSSPVISSPVISGTRCKIVETKCKTIWALKC